MVYPTLKMPTKPEVVQDWTGTPEQEEQYNQECNRLIVEALQSSGGYIRTHYPYNLPDGSSDDTLMLGEDGQIIVIDEGVQ